MAAKRAFSNAEIVEHILLSLPRSDLIRAAGINRAFKAIIDESATIQHALFLAPDSNADATHTRVNTILFETRSGSDSTFNAADTPDNPASRLVIHTELYCKLRGPAWQCLVVTTTNDKLEHIRALRTCRPDYAIWQRQWTCRRMFITQPPVEAVGIKMTVVGDQGPSTGPPVVHLVEVEGGVRFEDVLEAVKAYVALTVWQEGILGTIRWVRREQRV